MCCCVCRLADLKHDFTLSDEFRRNHYLTGLILHELKMAMSEPRDVRRSAITVLRNQLAKHSFDDRYQSKVGVPTMLVSRVNVQLLLLLVLA